MHIHIKKEVSIIAEYKQILQVTDEYRLDCVAAAKHQKQHCIFGIVTDCGGNPLEGVCVKILTADYEPVLHTLTDVLGAFTIIEQAGRDLQLIFAKEGYKTLQLQQFEKENHVCLQREPITCIVSGKLLYKNCIPAAPVKIKLTSGSAELCVFSKEDGNFLFARVPAGKYTLIIAGSDCKQQSLHITIPEHCSSYPIGTICVERINILCTVHGMITDTKGNPISNAVVVLMSCSTKAPVAHTLSNENGLYFFGNVRNGCYYVEAFE